VTLALSAADLAVDRQLADISDSFRFLLDVTPVNAEMARDLFLASMDDEPDFEYRALEDDPDVLRAELHAVDIGSVADHTLAHLVTAKRRELELKIDMLAARGAPDFRALSIELYGTVSPALLEHAEQLLDTLDPWEPEDRTWLDSHAVARMAEEELDHYRLLDPDLSVHVEIRPDVSGMMVADGNLLISPSIRVWVGRVVALLHHEIGTHVVTYVNGCHQPLRLLAGGLAGYEETQEGLALLAEHLCGGLTASRLRHIAARVVSVHRMVEGATFRELHDELVAGGFSEVVAYRMAVRVFRSGGFTKDLVYLRGLLALLDHLAAGHDLEVLLLGKMPLSAAPLIEALRERGVLAEPRLRPRYLEDPSAGRRVAELRQPRSVVDLLER
jgi:uncharacterized protein (TIGR02421 family)